MNRLDLCLKDAKDTGRKMFCAYVTMGYPDIEFTERLIPELEKVGVDILELGIPFSDPLADGPVIQDAAYEALENGAKVKDAFKLVKRLRDKGVQMPIVFFSYYNPVMSVGEDRFASKLKKSGFDAFLCPDLLPESAVELFCDAEKNDISPICLIAPTTVEKRREEILKKARGFVYYVARKGVTGTGSSLADDLQSNVEDIKSKTDLPVLVGFGVSTSEHVKSIAAYGDGVIVGSAIVSKIGETKSVRKVAEYVGSLIAPLRGDK